MNARLIQAHGWLPIVTALWLVSPSLPAHGGIVLNNTRVVFDGGKRETTVTVSNPTTQAYAVQAWVNTAADDDSIAAPFMATPPLFRLDSRKEQSVRLLGTQAGLPTDRESLFYFNVQEIPAAKSAEDNVLKVALRTRIKLFYRPQGLAGSPLEAGGQLQWILSRQAGRQHLRVINPTPFHVSFIGIKVVAERREDEIYAPVMVAPFASRSYPLANQDWAPDAVVFSTINDHGGYSTPLRRPLNSTH